MYFLGETPVEPTGIPTATEIPTAIVTAVETAVLPPETPTISQESAPPPPPPPPPSPAVTLPLSVSTGQPAPTDYSTRKRRHRGHWNPTPINVIYTDPTPYYFPTYPRDYVEPPVQQPIYVIREKASSNINWLLVLSAVAVLYILKA